MAVTKYSFTKLVDVPRLKSEILTSTIPIAIDRIEKDGLALDIYFKDVLPAGDETTLNNIVTAHVNTPLPEAEDPKTPVTKIPLVAVVDNEGDEGESIPSHDFTDPCTWYQNSKRITGETPTLESDGYYHVSKDYIIDCMHGRFTYENEYMAATAFKVYDDGVELVLDEHYVVDYERGRFKFKSFYTVQGVLTVDYSHAELTPTGSMFTIKPTAPGKVIKVTEAEVQFTTDVKMVPLFFEIVVPHPDQVTYPGVMVPVFQKLYKNIKDIINIARRGTGQIRAPFPLIHDIAVFPLRYKPSIVLRASWGQELRLYLKDGQPMEGEWGTMTFYLEEKDEV